MTQFNPAYAPRSRTFRGLLLTSTSMRALAAYGLPMASPPVEDRRFGIVGHPAPHTTVESAELKRLILGPDAAL